MDLPLSIVGGATTPAHAHDAAARVQRPDARAADLAPREAHANASVLKEASDSLERILASRHVRLKFSVDRVGPDRVVIELVDDRSGSVIKTIPPDKLMNVVSGMQELAGLLVDRRAG